MLKGQIDQINIDKQKMLWNEKQEDTEQLLHSCFEIL